MWRDQPSHGKREDRRNGSKTVPMRLRLDIYSGQGSRISAPNSSNINANNALFQISNASDPTTVGREGGKG